MKHYQKINPKHNQINKLNANTKPAPQLTKIYYYRKGRIPLNVREDQRHGYVCISEASNADLRFSDDPRKVEIERSQIRREKTQLQQQKNEEIFFRKVHHQATGKKLKSPSSSSNSAKKRANTEPVELKTKHIPLPQILETSSKHLRRMKLAIENWATSDLQRIEAKWKGDEVKRQSSKRDLVQKFKGQKLFYSLARSVSIPSSFT